MEKETMLKKSLLCLLLIIPIPCVAQISNPIIRTIGIESDEDSPYMLGLVVGLALDDTLNIYVLDRYSCEIRVFSWAGEYLRSIGRGKGPGPGEFLLPMGLSISPDNTLYIADYNAGRITLYKSDGEYIDQIPGIAAFTPPTVIDNEHFYMASSAGWTRPHMRKYSRDGSILIEAVDPVENAREIAFAQGSVVGHTATPDGNIVVVRPYPYEIMILDEDLNLIKKWPGEGGIVESPPELTRELGWQLKAKAHDVEVGPDGRIAVHISSREDDERASFLDFYSPDGTFISRIPAADFGIEFIQFYILAPDDILVCNRTDPYPQILQVDISSYLSSDGNSW